MFIKHIDTMREFLQVMREVEPNREYELRLSDSFRQKYQFTAWAIRLHREPPGDWTNGEDTLEPCARCGGEDLYIGLCSDFVSCNNDECFRVAIKDYETAAEAHAAWNAEQRRIREGKLMIPDNDSKAHDLLSDLASAQGEVETLRAELERVKASRCIRIEQLADVNIQLYAANKRIAELEEQLDPFVQFHGMAIVVAHEEMGTDAAWAMAYEDLKCCGNCVHDKKNCDAEECELCERNPYRQDCGGMTDNWQPRTEGE